MGFHARDGPRLGQYPSYRLKAEQAGEQSFLRLLRARLRYDWRLIQLRLLGGFGAQGEFTGGHELERFGGVIEFFSTCDPRVYGRHYEALLPWRFISAE
jgi:hypothetical protein